MHTHIKLCGMMRPADIKGANALKPDMIGFVFAEKSRRAVSPEQAAALKSRLDAQIRAVGVFVDEDPENIAELFHTGVIDIAQLHGSETAAVVARVKTLTAGQCPVIQAVAMRAAADVDRAESSPADLILLDAQGGGTGRAFNWALAKKVQRPYLLAGGLSADNIDAALQTLSPWGVDVSSGIEKGGYKDRTKMARFVEKVRACDQHSMYDAPSASY